MEQNVPQGNPQISKSELGNITSDQEIRKLGSHNVILG